MYSGLQHSCSCRFCVLSSVCWSVFETLLVTFFPGDLPLLGKLEEQEKSEEGSDSQHGGLLFESANMMAKVLLVLHQLWH